MGPERECLMLLIFKELWSSAYTRGLMVEFIESCREREK